MIKLNRDKFPEFSNQHLIDLERVLKLNEIKGRWKPIRVVCFKKLSKVNYPYRSEYFEILNIYPGLFDLRKNYGPKYYIWSNTFIKDRNTMAGLWMSDHEISEHFMRVSR
jgi:hypothetical protein